MNKVLAALIAGLFAVGVFAQVPAPKAAASASMAAPAAAAPKMETKAEAKASNRQRKRKTTKSAKAKDVAAGPALTLPAMPAMPGTPSAVATPAAAAPTQKPDARPLDSTSAATTPAAKPELNVAPGKSATATTDAAKTDRAETARADALKAEPAAADAGKATPDTPVTPAAPAKSDAKDSATASATDAAAPAVERAPATRPRAAPPRVVAPAPPPEPGFIDTLMKYGLWMAGALLALLLAFAGYLGLGAWRRRKQANEEAAETYQRFEPSVDSDAQTQTVAVATPAIETPTTTAVASPATPAAPASLTVATVTDLVDPVDEAKVYVNYGQFEQAEKVLRDAMSKEPGREAIQMALLELLAKRGNKDGFNQIAARLHKETGGVGDNWKRAAVLGYEMDPTHLLYSPPSAAARAEATLDIGQILAMKKAGLDPVAPPVAPLSEFNIELPPEDTPAGKNVVDASAAEPNLGLDFKVELPAAPATQLPDATVAPAPAYDALIEFVPVSVPAPTPTAITNDVMLAFTGMPPAPPATQIAVPVTAQPKDDQGLEFKIEPTVTEAQAASGVADPVTEAKVVEDVVERELLRSTKMRQVEPVRDEHWHDVQQKFDLVRAYQEMGDKEGVKEVLAEIEGEGDAEQKAEAQNIAQSIE